MQRAGQDDSFGAAPRLTGANSVIIFVMGPVIPLFGAGLSQVPLRIRDHRLRVDRIKRNAQRRKVHALKPRLSKLDFLAIGDSWFEYPLDDNGVFWPGYNAAIVAQGQLQSMGNPPPLINSIAHHGQSMQAIMGVTNQELMESLVGDDTNWLNGKPDAILVSGGGDDIVGDQFIIYLTYASGGLNASRFQGVLDSVQASYEDLFAFRDEFVPNVPIFGHCYDYAIPNGKPAGLIPIAGPGFGLLWILRAMTTLKVSK
jgi:hypothetical protein